MANINTITHQYITRLEEVISNYINITKLLHSLNDRHIQCYQ